MVKFTKEDFGDWSKFRENKKDTLDADILDSMEDIVEDDWVKIKDE